MMPLTPNTIAIIVVLLVVLFVGWLCWLGAYGDRLRELHLCFMQIFYTPLQQVTEWCQNGRRAILAWMREEGVKQIV